MLSKKNRLKKKDEIDSVFRRGKTAFSHSLFIRYSPNDLPVSRFAFSIGLKFSPLATERNRVKRVLRAIIHEKLTAIAPGYDLVFYFKGQSPEKLDKKSLGPMVQDLLKRARLT